MGRKGIRRIISAALALALCAGSAGCTVSRPQEAEPDIASGKMMVVDKEPRGSAPDFREAPSINAEPDLPDLPENGPALEEEKEAGKEASVGVTELRTVMQNGAESKTGGIGYASTAAKNSYEVKAVWISYLDLAPILTGKTEKQFASGIREMFDNVKDYGLNTVFVHVRPFGDALYDSDYFPWSYLCSGTEGKDPGYDPLAVMVAEAKERGLRIEAWVNPYRVRAKGNEKALSADNQAAKWLSAGTSDAIRYDGVTSYNPASPKARELIINGVREIVRNYDVDGIHIDDYFYPHTAEAFDKSSYAAYQRNGGKLGLADWRRSNVEKLIGNMYAAVKEENKTVLFGISPQSSVHNNYNAQYLDVEKIVSKAGYCDYICPQIYFGFENETQPFAETLDVWSDMVKTDSVRLYVGLAAYKCGAPDSWAGKGSKEWQQNSDLLKQMTEYARDAKYYGGLAVYRYDSLFNPDPSVRGHVSKESANLKKILPA